MAPELQIHFEDDDKDLRAALTNEVLADLAGINRQSDNLKFSFYCKHDGDMVAGISCATSYDWMHIELLWVKADRRRRGLGTRLLARAEAYATRQGAKRAWLETSNKDAISLYTAQGYIPFGRLTNDDTQFPPEIERVFMEKRLAD